MATSGREVYGVKNLFYMETKVILAMVLLLVASVGMSILHV